MNNKQLHELRTYYLQEAVDAASVNKSWEALAKRLPDRQYHPQHYTVRYVAAFLSLVLMFTAVLFAIGSIPASPVRQFSEQAAATISGRYDVLLEKKTEQIINAAQKKSDQDIQQAANEYQQALKKASENQSTTHTNDALKETLKVSEEKLRSVTPASSKSRTVIQESIKATEQTQQDVKGAKTENKQPEQSQNNNNGNNNAQNNGANDHKPENPGNSENKSIQGSLHNESPGNGNNKNK